MNKIITICFLSISFLINAQTMDWAYSFKNPAVLEGVTDVSSNGSNRFAVIGYGNSGISMDPINMSSAFNSQGNFLALYNEMSQIQWIAPTIGNAYGVKMNNSGAVYVAGRATNGTTYLQKYSSNSNLDWTGSATVDGNASEIEELADGRVIVAGRVDVSSSVTLSNNTIVNLDKGAYLLEFSSTGSLNNAYGISVPDAAGYIYTFDLASDANNNIYLCGQLDGIADFDLGSGVAQNTTTNAYDAYVVKYNSAFQLQWFKKFGDSNTPKGWDKARTLQVDAAENVYLGGEFTWSTDFDPANAQVSVISSDDNSQVPSGFVLQYAANGTLNWVVKLGNDNALGNSTDYASVSVADLHINNNNLYVLLEGYGVVDMDPSSANHYLNIGSNSSPSFFIGKYSLSADYVGSFAIGSANTNTTSITTTVGFEALGNDAFCVAGTFQKSIDFDPTSAIFNLECTPGTFYNFDNDIYLAKYSFSGINSITDGIESISLSVYPNPFNDYISVNESVKVEIFDNQGKLVLLDADLNDKVNTSNLKSGLYTLKLSGANKITEYKKMVKP